MISLTLILLVLAFVCFLVSAIGIPVPRVNLVAMGLALWVLSILLGGEHFPLR
jgi:hypothetical protein